MTYDKKYECLCSSICYGALKYFAETVTPRTFPKIIISYSFLSDSTCFFGKHIKIFNQNF